MAHVRRIAGHRMFPWVLVGFLSILIIALSFSTGTAQKAGKPPTTFRETLTAYEGFDSNLGKIKRIASDFLLVQDENTQRVIPLMSIQEVRVVKENASEPAKVDIRLLAKD